METIHLLIAISAQIKWKIFQLDVKSAFLNGYLEEEVYVTIELQPLEELFALAISLTVLSHRWNRVLLRRSPILGFLSSEHA